MLTLHRILLASDMPASALAALQYAAPLARMTGATLHLLQVVDTRVSALPRWTDIFRSTEAFAALEEARQETPRQLLAQPALADLHVETMERRGHPTDAIVDAAAQVDFVVLGLQGHDTPQGEAARALVQQIVPACPVPLLLVPAAALLADAPESAPTLPWRRILLALHISEYASLAVSLTLDLARACQASVQVVQVFNPQQPYFYTLQVDTGLTHSVGALKGWLQQQLQDAIPEATVPVERLVLEGYPAEVILKQAHSGGAQLIVMSAHAYEGLQKLFHASTVDAVWQGTPCPILTVPLRPS